MILFTKQFTSKGAGRSMFQFTSKSSSNKGTNEVLTDSSKEYSITVIDAYKQCFKQ